VSTTFTTCVTEGVSNDDCSGALSIVPDGACVSGDGTHATQSLAAGCGSSSDDDVWFTFKATNTTQFIEVHPSSGYDPIVQLFSGSCASLTSVKCYSPTDGNGVDITGTFTGLTVGATYYYRVYNYNTVSPTFTFTTCVKNPVVNDDCSGAILLPVTSACEYKTFNNSNATDPTTDPSCITGAHNDVWFKAVVPANGEVYAFLGILILVPQG